jgi:hypothetical protein
VNERHAEDVTDDPTPLFLMRLSRLIHEQNGGPNTYARPGRTAGIFDA